MTHRIRENHMYTTIAPELQQTEELLDPNNEIDTTLLEMENYDLEKIIKDLLAEEEYYERLIEKEPKKNGGKI